MVTLKEYLSDKQTYSRDRAVDRHRDTHFYRSVTDRWMSGLRAVQANFGPLWTTETRKQYVGPSTCTIVNTHLQTHTRTCVNSAEECSREVAISEIACTHHFFGGALCISVLLGECKCYLWSLTRKHKNYKQLISVWMYICMPTHPPHTCHFYACIARLTCMNACTSTCACRLVSVHTSVARSDPRYTSLSVYIWVDWQITPSFVTNTRLHVCRCAVCTAVCSHVRCLHARMYLGTHICVPVRAYIAGKAAIVDTYKHTCTHAWLRGSDRQRKTERGCEDTHCCTGALRHFSSLVLMQLPNRLYTIRTFRVHRMQSQELPSIRTMASRRDVW